MAETSFPVQELDTFKQAGPCGKGVLQTCEEKSRSKTFARAWLVRWPLCSNCRYIQQHLATSIHPPEFLTIYEHCAVLELLRSRALPVRRGSPQGLNEAAYQVPGCGIISRLRKVDWWSKAFGSRRKLSEGTKDLTRQGLHGSAQAFLVRIVFFVCPALKATGQGCNLEKRCQPSQGCERNGQAKLNNFQQAVRPPTESILLLVVTKCRRHQHPLKDI